MTKTIALGTATAQPGSIQYGQWTALSHPTGHEEFLPVIIAQGKVDGPCLWLTAGIHGDEHAGPAVIYRLITPELVEQMRGTIVAVPALNPAGLRSVAREPYHVRKDPNRLWPDGKPPKPHDPDKKPPSSLERAYARLFEAMGESADFLIDLHNAWTGSIPFSFRDRVLYRADQDAEQNKAAAEALSERLYAMLCALGMTIVNEYPPEKYIDEDLHRSTSGAALLLHHIPATTIELGTAEVPDYGIVAAGVTGVRNMMRWAGMLDGDREPIHTAKVVNPGYAVRRCSTPRVTEPCVVLHRVEAGDMVKTGDAVAEVRDIWGRPLGDGLIRAEYDGLIMGRSHGIYYYPGDSVVGMAIPDQSPLVAPYPEDYFKK